MKKITQTTIPLRIEGALPCWASSRTRLFQGRFIDQTTRIFRVRFGLQDSCTYLISYFYRPTTILRFMRVRRSSMKALIVYADRANTLSSFWNME